MNEWVQVQSLLGQVLVSFLGDVLPGLGGARWWHNHVLMQLTPVQQQMVNQLPEGQLRRLDMAALLRVTSRNWSEIAFTRKMSREAKHLIGELQDARNRYAHASVDGVALDDRIRDVDTAVRLMVLLGADQATLWPVKQILEGMRDDADGGDCPRSHDAQSVEHATGAVTPSDEPEAQTAAEIPAGWLLGATADGHRVSTLLAGRSYIGIDFGTSTTVVSALRIGAKGGVEVEPLSIAQPGEYGESIRTPLVNTVLAWTGERLIFGADAYRMRQFLFEGKDVFSSFKMRLGVDIGPVYPATSLRRGSSPTPIETAQDAAYCFFSCLRPVIDQALAEGRLASELCLAVSVPASFEANQRRDLSDALNGLGLSEKNVCMIDEPNAAFFSYLHQTALTSDSTALFDRLRREPTNVLVYDFGAGTCDISILEVGLEGGTLRSRNRAISRFTALGGDDIDRAIARDILLPQLLQSAPGYEPTQREIDERLVPWLQPTAERLKISALKWASARNLSSLNDYDGDSPVFIENPVRKFIFGEHELSIEEPSATLSALAGALEPFLGVFDSEQSSYHVFAPVQDAVQKCGIDVTELYAVLFIGGSCGNLLVQHAVMRMLPKSVVPIIPRDLQTHVSIGAALHSFAYHGLSLDLVQPITAEPIMVVTKGAGLETLIPAGSPVPTVKEFERSLVIDRHGQQVVEVPICVSNESKLLGMLRIEAGGSSGFRQGTKVLLHASLTHDKLLILTASADGVRVSVTLTKPLTNSETTTSDALLLDAKQRYNMELLQTRGKPSIAVVLQLAAVAAEARAYELAADMYMLAQRLDPSISKETHICHAFSMAGRSRQASEWARKAYQRSPDAVAAYNMSCFSDEGEREKYLIESIAKENPPARAFLELGKIYKNNGNSSGVVLIEKCVRRLEDKLGSGDISENECRLLEEAASVIRKDAVAARARVRRENRVGLRLPYSEDNLAASVSNGAVLGELA